MTMINFISHNDRAANMTSHSALVSTPSSAVKRSAPAEFDNNDTENVDPRQFFSDSSKKAKTFDFDTSHLMKPARYALNVTPANTPTKRATPTHAAGQKRKIEVTAHIHHPEPSSAPALSAAGRSPKHKRVGILSKRRHTTTRIDPPSFNSPKISQPFSIATALHGTVPTPSRISKSKTNPSPPAKAGSSPSMRTVKKTNSPTSWTTAPKHSTYPPTTNHPALAPPPPTATNATKRT